MGLNTEISWCDHTLNLWWGCFKVSPGCKHCYADTLDNRYNQNERHWGLNSPRKLVRSWKKNLNDMQKSAIKNNRRETVFVMSMGDIFEDDMPLSNHDGFTWKGTDDVRQEFFKMIPDYPELIFLLLTKRPENIRKMWPFGEIDTPENVLFGTSIVEQKEVSKVFDLVKKSPSRAGIFVSMEPLLGHVLLGFEKDEIGGNPLEYLSWIIVGGESGPKARPMNPEWARSLRDESLAAGIPFHFKQWGENLPIESSETLEGVVDGRNEPIQVKKLKFSKVGKHNAGNHLDGVQHLNFPPSFHKPIKEKATV